jgi:hypothetical protein
MSFDRYDVSPELDRLVLASRNTSCFVCERRDKAGTFFVKARTAPGDARVHATILLADSNFDETMAFIRKALRRESPSHDMSDTQLRNECAARGLALVQRGMVFDLMQGTRSAGRNLSRADVIAWIERKN